MDKSPAKPAKRTRDSYSEAEITRGLVTVAACNGNCCRAARLLEGDGLKINPETLRRWHKTLHAAKYESIRAELLPKIQAWAAEQHRQLSEREMEVSAKLIERLEREVDQIPARDLPGGIRNLDTGAGINRDKAQLLAGEPTARLERSADEVLRALAAKGVNIASVIESRPVRALSVGEEDEAVAQQG